MKEMKFVEKLKTFATGKTDIERKQEASAMRKIRKKATSAGLQERQKQAIRLATEREKIRVDRQIKAMHQPRPSIASGFNFGTPFGEPRQIKQVKTKPRKRTIKRWNPILGGWD